MKLQVADKTAETTNEQCKQGLDMPTDVNIVDINKSLTSKEAKGRT